MAGGRRSHGQGTFWGDLIGPNPTDRGKAGTKRSLLVDGEGGPLSIVVAGANVHDAKPTLDAIVVERPQPTEEDLCLDKGYDNPSLPPDTAIGSTHRRGEAGRLSTSGIRRAGGLWNGRHGSPTSYDKKAELPRCAARSAPVVPAVASGHFEIVTKSFVQVRGTAAFRPGVYRAITSTTHHTSHAACC